MAIAFVRATEGSVVGTTLTLNIEVSSGTDRILVIGLAYKSNSVIAPDGIVFNSSESLTVERVAADGGDAQCFLWKLTGITETTADVVITMPSSLRMVGYVAYFTGVNQSTPFTGNSVDANGTNDTPTDDISSASDEMCIDVMAQVSADPDTIDANSGTLICSGAATGGGSDTRGGGQYQVGTGTRTMSYTMSSTDNWNICVGALQEPSSVTQIDFADTLALTTLSSNLILFRLTDYADTLNITSLSSDIILFRNTDYGDTLSLTTLTSDISMLRDFNFIDTLSLTTLTSDVILSGLTTDFADTLALTTLTSDLIFQRQVDFDDALPLTTLTSDLILFRQSDFSDTLALTTLTSTPLLNIFVEFANMLALTTLTSDVKIGLLTDFADTLGLTTLTSDAILFRLSNLSDTLNITTLTSDLILSGLTTDFADTLSLTTLTSDLILFREVVFDDSLNFATLTSNPILIVPGIQNFADTLALITLTSNPALIKSIVVDNPAEMFYWNGSSWIQTEGFTLL